MRLLHQLRTFTPEFGKLGSNDLWCNNMLDKISRQIAEELQRLGKTSEVNTAEYLKPVIERTLRSLDLVTREEFDAQTAVLHRTREKIEELTRQMENLQALCEQYEQTQTTK